MLSRRRASHFLGASRYPPRNRWSLAPSYQSQTYILLVGILGRLLSVGRTALGTRPERCVTRYPVGQPPTPRRDRGPNRQPAAPTQVPLETWLPSVPGPGTPPSERVATLGTLVRVVAPVDDGRAVLRIIRGASIHAFAAVRAVLHGLGRRAGPGGVLDRPDAGTAGLEHLVLAGRPPSLCRPGTASRGLLTDACADGLLVVHCDDLAQLTGPRSATALAPAASAHGRSAGTRPRRLIRGRERPPRDPASRPTPGTANGRSVDNYETIGKLYRSLRRRHRPWPGSTGPAMAATSSRGGGAARGESLGPVVQPHGHPLQPRIRRAPELTLEPACWPFGLSEPGLAS
jgi:hypothetical protein